MDYYELLEISRNASQEVIKNAYRALAKKYHPDTCNYDSEFIEKKMSQINEAYEVLSDVEKRAIYDQELKDKEAALKQEYTDSVTNDSKNNNLQTEVATSVHKNTDKKQTIKKEKIKKMVIIGAVAFFIIAILTFIIVSIVIEPSYFNGEEKEQEDIVENVEEQEEKKSNNDFKVDKDNQEYNIKNYNDDEVIDNNINNDINNKDNTNNELLEEDNIVKIY